MDNGAKKKTAGSRLVFTKSLFINSILVVVLTIVAVWVLGLGTHRTLFANSLLSVSILSLFFFLYLFFGLYRGIKLKDNVGRITDKIGMRSFKELSGGLDGCSPDGEGILAWLFLAIAAIILIWILGNVLWMLILVFMAMLYWIFFRALRLVFKRSPACRGNLLRSAGFAIIYTLLYNFWIYGIIMGAHFLIYRI